jgi:predicted nucleotidyltransferase
MVPKMGTKQDYSLAGGTLFGATRQAVLRTLFGHAERRFYQRQLIRMLDAGTGAVQRELATLVEAGVVTRTVEGRQTYFKANADSPVFAELRALIRKTFGVSEVLRNALEPLTGSIRLAFIYGSIAAGSEKAGSDIDLLVVGDRISLDDVISALGEAQQLTGREVNPSFYPSTEFRRKLTEGQHFLTRVVSGPKLFLIGNDSELTRLAQLRMAEGTSVEPRGDRRSVRRRRS